MNALFAPQAPPVLTFSKLLKGFEEWFNTNFQEIQTNYTPEAQELFDTLEDFAVELYCEAVVTI